MSYQIQFGYNNNLYKGGATSIVLDSSTISGTSSYNTTTQALTVNWDAIIQSLPLSIASITIGDNLNVFAGKVQGNLNNIYDLITSGQQNKDAVLLASTGGNTILSGIQSIDGVMTGNNQRVVITVNTDQTTNGIYLTNSTGAWTRTTDANTWDLLIGATVFVESGNLNAGKYYQCNITSGGTLGVDPITFIFLSDTNIYSATDGIQLIGTIFSLDPTYDATFNTLNVTDAPTTRSNLGLGSASLLNIGTAIGNAVQYSGTDTIGDGLTIFDGIATGADELYINNLSTGNYYLTAVKSTGMQDVYSSSSFFITPSGILNASIFQSFNLNTPSALVSDASGKIGISSTSSTELSYVHGVTSSIQNQLNNKAPSFSGYTSQYVRGDGSYNTLDTSVVPENGNLYFTTARVLSTPLTGYALGSNSTLVATDTELQAFGKLQAQINAIGGETTVSNSFSSSQLTTTVNGVSSTPININGSNILGYDPVNGISTDTVAYDTALTNLYNYASTKATNSLTSAYFFVGNVSNLATGVAMSGDINLTNTGLTTINSNVVTNSKLAQMPANTWKGNNTGSLANSSDNATSSLTESISSVLTIMGASNSLLNTVTIQVKQASTSQSGYLSDSDWNTFNSKMSLISSPTNGDIMITNSSGQALDSGIVFTNIVNSSSTSSQVPYASAVYTAIQNAISGAVLFQGTWNASTNTPLLTAGIGTVGYAYFVSVAGTQTLPSGVPTTYAVGDVIFYTGTGIWDSFAGGNTVVSVNGMTGIVSLGIANMNDASISSPSDAQFLIYNNSSSKWQNESISGAFTINNLGVATLSTVPISKGGTGQTTQQLALNAIAGATTNNYVPLGNGTNVIMAQLGYSNLSGNGSTNITTLGTVTTGTWQATQIGISYGGTNLTSYTLGDMLYASATNTLAKLPGNITSNQYILTQTGTGSISAAPAWSNSLSISSLNLSSLTASQAVVTDSSNNLISLAYSTSTTANSLVQRDANKNIFGNYFVPNSNTFNSSVPMVQSGPSVIYTTSGSSTFTMWGTNFFDSITTFVNTGTGTVTIVNSAAVGIGTIPPYYTGVLYDITGSGNWILTTYPNSLSASPVYNTINANYFVANANTRTVTGSVTYQLISSSFQNQQFTGSGTATVYLTDATTIPINTTIIIDNFTSNTLIIDSWNNTVSNLATVYPNCRATCILTNVSSQAGVWLISISYPYNNNIQLNSLGIGTSFNSNSVLTMAGTTGQFGTGTAWATMIAGTNAVGQIGGYQAGLPNEEVMAGWYFNSLASNKSQNTLFTYSGLNTRFDQLQLDGSAATVSILNSNLNISNAGYGIGIKSATVSGSTANAYFVKGVVLSSGASGTINNSAVTTSCAGFAGVQTAGGTVGAYTVTCGSGTFSVKSTSGSDTSTIFVVFFLGN